MAFVVEEDQAEHPRSKGLPSGRGMATGGSHLTHSIQQVRRGGASAGAGANGTVGLQCMVASLGRNVACWATMHIRTDSRTRAKSLRFQQKDDGRLDSGRQRRSNATVPC